MRTGIATTGSWQVRDLRAAVTLRELTLVHEPVVDLATGRTVTVRSAVRWTPHGVDVPAAEFLPVAEHYGLLTEITVRALQATAAAHLAWYVDGSPSGASVAVPVRLLSDQRVVATAAAVGAELAGLGSQLHVEVVGDDLWDGRRLTGAQTLLDAGVALTLADVGAGRRVVATGPVPFDHVVLDAAVVGRSAVDTRVRAVARALVRRAQSDGSLVAARGVGTFAELAAARALGVDLVAGDLVARPAAAWQVPQAVRRAGATVRSLTDHHVLEARAAG